MRGAGSVRGAPGRARPGPGEPGKARESAARPRRARESPGEPGRAQESSGKRGQAGERPRAVPIITIPADARGGTPYPGTVTFGTGRVVPGESQRYSPEGGAEHRPVWNPRRCRPAAPGGWHVRWTASTGSTNDDLAGLAGDGPSGAPASGATDRTVLVADLQTAGRGRRGRSWHAPARSALTFSVLLRPSGVPQARRGWIGALLGLAVLAGIDRRTGLVAGLKWPNDVLIEGRKVAGILAMSAGSALVVGAGINVTIGADELPRPDAASLLLAGADPGLLGREELLAAVLDEFAPLLDRWVAAGGDVECSGLRAEYLARCVSVGRAVTIQLPGSDTVTGRAVDVAPDGSIVIDDGRTQRRFAAGDVVHLRTR